MGIFDKVGDVFGGLGKSSEKTTNGPWGPQAGYLKQGFEGAGNWLDNVNQRTNTNITDAWQGKLNAAQGGFGGAVSNQNQISNFFSNPDMLNPASNPYLQGNLDALGDAVTRQAGRNNNQISQQAVQAGAMGGGRQGVAQGLNAEAATNAFTENANQMLMDNYNQRLQQMQAQQNFLPQQVQMSMMPYTVMEQVGRAQQDEPINNLMKFWNIVGSNNWGSQQNTTSQASPIDMFTNFAQGLGGMAQAGYGGG